MFPVKRKGQVCLDVKKEKVCLFCNADQRGREVEKTEHQQKAGHFVPQVLSFMTLICNFFLQKCNYLSCSFIKQCTGRKFWEAEVGQKEKEVPKFIFKNKSTLSYKILQIRAYLFESTIFPQDPESPYCVPFCR